MQEFFETTIPRILHPVVKQWAVTLYVLIFDSACQSETDFPLFDACRMDERRTKWAERGWEDFKAVLPTPDEPTAAAEEKKETIPVRVYGSHGDKE